MTSQWPLHVLGIATRWRAGDTRMAARWPPDRHPTASSSSFLLSCARQASHLVREVLLIDEVEALEESTALAWRKAESLADLAARAADVQQELEEKVSPLPLDRPLLITF